MAHRMAVGLATMVATVGSTLVVAPAADAARDDRRGVAVSAVDRGASAQRTHTCVDNFEWRTFDLGDSRGYIHRLFDTAGVFRWQHGRFQKRAYLHCGAVWDRVVIIYRWNGFSWRAVKATRYR